MSDSSDSRESSPGVENVNAEKERIKDVEGDIADNLEGEISNTPFSSLGLIPELLQTVSSLNYQNATSIQVQAIPPALEGRDIIGVAKTGSGKTAAFALPILQKWWEDPKPLYALVIAPTR
jgi:ATP-dependent RNA helicase DDX47/RRP3